MKMGVRYIRLLGVCAILLTGCAFQPMMAPIHNVHPLKIRVRGCEGYINHALTQEVERQLAQLPRTQPLGINIKLIPSLYDTSYGRDATALRTQYIFTAEYELTSNGALLHKGTVDATTSYNLNQTDEFSALTSRMGSEEQLIRSTASEIAGSVARYLVLRKDRVEKKDFEATHHLSDNF